MEKLYQSIGKKIRQRIIDEEYKIGDKLPAERVLSEMYSVSRQVIREAVIMLEIEGYVDVVKGSGIHVRANQAGEAVLKLSQESASQELLDIINELNTAGPFELLQARQLIEGIIVELAASKVRKSDVTKLTSIIERSEKEDRDQFSLLDEEFHTTLAEITDNSVLVSVVRLLFHIRFTNPIWKKLLEHASPEAAFSWNDDHSAILDKIMTTTPLEAKEEMWRHIENTKVLLSGSPELNRNPYDKHLFANSEIPSTTKPQNVQ